ncbi:hypothetical protein AB0M54_23865 [Actinoplanes sp. NPDC051470]|uniref:hypothetical protein n=1 Tax=unclassified Actinoplanes TaxID=2626549 RepID=UPI003448C44F
MAAEKLDFETQVFVKEHISRFPRDIGVCPKSEWSTAAPATITARVHPDGPR